jgi:hypothetical protein
MQVSAPLVGGGFGAPGIPATGAMTATSGAATLGGAGPVVSTNLVGGPAAAMPVLGTWPAAAPVVATITGSPALLGQGAAATAALPMPISTVTPAGASAAPAPAAGAAGTQPLTTLAPGGSPQDAALVEQTLNVLRQSPSGAQVVDRLLAVGAKINVISDAEFQSMGHDSAHAFYDPKIDTMFLRRSDLADANNINFAAVALAHEGTHLLDDVANLADPMVSQITSNVVAAGGLNTPAGIEAREQGMFELMMVKEARAFTFAGQVARDLQVKLDDTDPTKVAISGGNDQTTYNAVWQRLLQSSYNPQGRTAAVRNL